MKRTCRFQAAALGCVAGMCLLAAGRAAPQLALDSVSAVDTQPVTLTVTLTADGSENALGWSVAFDPARLTFQQALLGDDAAGAALQVNTTQAAAGRVGFAVALPPDTAFAPGGHALLHLRFTAHGSGATPLTFSDSPVAREVVDVNGAGLAPSFVDGTVTIAELLPPTIVTPPADAAVYAGANAIFRVAVTSDAPVRYQWQRDGVDLPGETGSRLVVRRVSAADAGAYRVVARNGAGAVTSREAALTVKSGLREGLIGQWDFDGGDLTASVGRDLAYRGDTAEVTTFTTVDVDGAPAGVMEFPRATRTQGYRLFREPGGNGGGNRLNRYTVIFDLFFPASSDRHWRALWQTNPANSDDGQFYVGPHNGLWLSGEGEHGADLVTPEAWHRLAFVVDVTAGTVGAFVDGTLAHRYGISSTIDNAYSLGAETLLFTENNNETAAGRVNSVQLYDRPLSDGEIGELGAPMAEGLPQGVEDQLRPSLVAQPLAQTVRAGETVTLSVVARGTPPLSYRWQRDGADLPGETGPQLTLPAVTAADAGVYRVTVANALGAITSDPAEIAVSDEARTLGFAPVEILQGRTVEVAVKLHALGGEQAWSGTVQFDPASLRFVEARAAGNGAALVNPDELASGRVGLLCSLPPGRTFAAGDATVVTLSFVAIGEAVVTPLTWTNAPIPLKLVSAGGQDRAVTPVAGAVAILSAPRITSQPESTAGAPGGAVAFSVEAVGTEPLSYQWRFNGADIAGATGPTLLLENLQPDQAGEYSVEISNRVGSAVSDGARLVIGRLLRVESLSGFATERVEVPIQLFALGGENSLGGSVVFDPERVELLDVAAGAQAAGASVLFNDATPGRVGFGVALPAGQTFSQGWHEVARVAVRTAEPVAGALLRWADDPVRVEVADARARPLPVSTMDGRLTTTIRPVDITKLPDLIPDQLTGPATAQLGQPVDIQWRVRNDGLQPAVAPWREALYVAAAPDAAERKLLAQLTVSEDLPPGGEITRTLTLVLPPAAAGVNHLIVAVDSQNAVAERVETNNETAGADTLTLRAPDLVAENLTAPASALQGAELTVAWTVRNAGTADTAADWRDRLYLVPALGTLADAVTLATLEPPVASLAPNGSYRRETTVTLPLSRDVPVGAYRLTVVTDFDHGQSELDESNNATSRPFELTRPPLPDLTVRSVTPPAAARPGVPFDLTWVVENRGNAAARAPWTESLTFVHPDLGERSLGLVEVSDDLAPGASVTRTETVTLPAAAPVGTIHLAVATDARDDVVEQNEVNNRREASAGTAVTRVLTLRLPLTGIREDAAPPTFLATVVRSGARDAALTVQLTNSDPSELLAPATVEIPAGRSEASFTLRVLHDGVVDGPQTVTLTASAPGHESARASLTVRDVDVPRLTLAFAPAEVREDQRARLTVTRELVSDQPLTVVFESAAPGQVMAPEPVEIPAQAASATVEVVPLDDVLLEPAQEYELRAFATGYEVGTARLKVLDNDQPAITVTVDRNAVSEGDGPQALNATITRSPTGPQAIEVELESSDPAALEVPARVSIGPNQASVSVPVGAVDDDRVDGDQTAWIRPFLLGSSSRVRLGEGAGAKVIVRDDDGPALFVAVEKKLVAEGLTPAMRGTVTRNTDPAAPLTVRLSSSDESEATVPATVTFPAGATSVKFPINTVPDDQPDGDQPVTVQAIATGYSTGEDNFIVSDLDLPDLVVRAVSGPEFVETDRLFNITYSVANEGLAPAGTNWLTRVYLSPDPVVGDDQLLTQYQFTGTLPVNQEFQQTLAVQSPLQAGDYWIVVVTDVANQVAEGVEDNNARVSATPVTVRPNYLATVATDVDQALAGTPIEFYGRALNAQGRPAPSALVNIHIFLRGTERVISALTKADGTFRTTWQPLPGEAGLYEIGATHPGVERAEIQDRFILVGMRADPAQRNFRVVEGESVSGRIRLLNLSSVPLHGLRVVVGDKPANLDLETALGADTLEGLSELALDYTVTARDASIPGGWIPLTVTSTEGAGVDITLGVGVDALRPRLVARPDTLRAGLLRGRARTLEFVVSNQGGRESGALNVALPDVPWMSLASENPIPSLAPGASNVVAVLLTPPEDLALGKYNGSLALAGDDTFLNVPFDFRVMSEGKGALRVEVVDEFTYYAEGAPKVEGATVKVRDPFDYTVVASGVTGADGGFAAGDLREGWYDVDITAPKHTTFHQSVFIEPGATNELTAFLSRETVHYTWKVEPVEVEDHYKITVETEFETVVPAPVITVEPPVIDLGKITADITQVNITISNHGLIAADAARLNLPTHPDWIFEALIEDIGVLPAQSSLTIPLTIRKVRHGVGLAAARERPRPPSRRMSEGARRLMERVALQSGACHTAATVTWELNCGPIHMSYSSTVSMPNASSGCGGGGPVAVGGGCWCGGSGGGGGGGGGGISYSGPSVNVAVQCDPWCVAIALAGCIPGVNCVPAGVGCGYGFASGGVSALTVFDCAFGIAGCVFPPLSGPSCIYALVRCFVGPAASAVALAGLSGPDLLPAAGLQGAASEAGGSVFRDAIKVFEPGARANLELVDLLLGGHLAEWAQKADPDTGEWWRRLREAVAENSEAGRLISPTEQEDLTTGTLPPGVSQTELLRLIGRLNRTVQNWTQGVLEPQMALAAGEGGDFISWAALNQQLETVQAENRKAREAGYATPFTAMMDIMAERMAAGEGGTCAKVRLRLEQEAVVTRDAFQATLEIQNDDTTTLDHIRVTVRVFDQDGRDVSDLFGIHDPELVGLSDVAGGGMVGPGAAGSAQWLIVPSVDAAPEKATDFFVGGEFGYVIEGKQVTVPLEPVRITVLPAPLLYVKYFHQRDVFSDDPFTPQIEPSVPFNLAVMIENRGFGVARDFKITSAQPEIVDNEKGLLIDFKIIATEVAGQSMTPSLTANFGDINPGETVVGRWLMTSTLQGLFTDYQATFEHVDGLGNPRLSLIQDLSIHELVHLIRAGGPFADGKPDFFVNEVPDALDFGDTLYLSDGSTNHVELVDQATVDGPPTASDLEVVLTAAMPDGWSYLRVPDPADGRFLLVRVVRSDGVEIPVDDNAWVTDRTFIGMGRRPRRENILHLVDYDSTGVYTLTYARPPGLDLEPPVSAVDALPADSRVLIPLTWSGTDNDGGSGIAAYDIYVSENGGPFRRWLWNTPDTSGSYLGQAGNHYAFYSRARDAAGNLEDAPATPDAETTVTILNQPPLLDPIADQVITEGETLRLQVSGSDPDGDTLTYGLEDDPPPGMVINAHNGELRWTTGEGLGGKTYPVTVSVLDGGTPRLGTTRRFTVTVRDLNNAPVLHQQPDQVVREGQLLTVQNRAEDFDVPAQTIRFALADGAPAGMTIDPATGRLTWRPGNTQGGRAYEVTVLATDDGQPPLTGRMTFTIQVRDTRRDFSVQVGEDRVAPGETGTLPVRLRSGEELRDVRFRLSHPPYRRRIAEIRGAPLVAGASVTVAPAPDLA